MTLVTVAVNGRTRPEAHAAKALAIARSGRVIFYTGPWRRIAAIAHLLPAEEDGLVLAVHRFPSGPSLLMAGSVKGVGTVPIPPTWGGPAEAWEGLAPVADRI
jgi:hypothetical protein